MPSFREVFIPTWVVVGTLFSQLAVRRVRCRGRDHRGLCLACGYDLRVTPRRCPECGRDASDRLTTFMN